MKGTIGFIGAGNMGSALIKGMIASGKFTADSILAFDVDNVKIDALIKETGINKAAGIEELSSQSDVIIIAVKPNTVSKTTSAIKEKLSKDKIVVSIAAGVTLQTLSNLLGAESKLIRVMPNTPALVGEGVSVLASSDSVTDDELKTVKALFDCVGRTEILPESMMPAVTALSGSSPAYVFIMIEAMADAAVRFGVKRDVAYELAAQAVYGSAKMVLETGSHPGKLKDMVCSPGGTTIEAVATLEAKGFRDAIIEAMKSCAEKAKEMEFGRN